MNEKTTIDGSKLSGQVCFHLYAASKEITRRYKPLLDEMDLTYTQYIAMMVLWDKKKVNVKELGKHLYLDSGTLTPLLKKLEAKGYVSRRRSKMDERNLIVSITPEGEALQDKAAQVPGIIRDSIDFPMDKMEALHSLLNDLLGVVESCEEE